MPRGDGHNLSERSSVDYAEIVLHCVLLCVVSGLSDQNAVVGVFSATTQIWRRERAVAALPWSFSTAPLKAALRNFAISHKVTFNLADKEEDVGCRAVN